jgi:DNA-binding PadR family transcriptional regulator
MDVKTICLGVLCTREATGYDIKKHFETAFSHFFLAGFGSIYPALAELSDAGLVSCEEQSSGGRPGRKVYRATEAGQTTFLQALKETEPRHKVRSEFLVLMYFAQLMPIDRLREVLDQRATEIEEMLAGVDQFEASQSELMSHGERFVSGYGRALLIAARDYLDHHRHLLEQCEQQGCGETADKALQATA